MPSTYNGIGTQYYGKKDIQSRPGPCPHCGRPVELISYNTRLWFVVLFIPIIPLGRKRIIDYCSLCTRHFASDADKWETAKQLEISGALEKFRSSGTPEDAIAVHQQMFHFHQYDQAAKFRKSMLDKHPDNARVRAYLGAALEQIGENADAEGHYARALELRPDMPEARAGLARARIRSGKLDEARALLDFMEKPGASQLYSLEPVDALARAYQGAGRHEEALSVFAIIQKELPKISEEKWFRDLVARSEKALGRKDSQLPKLKLSWKRFFSPQPSAQGWSSARLALLVGIALALAALGFVITNEYIRRHRVLRVVNVFSQPATLRIDGVGEFKKIRGHWSTPMIEGRYHAVVSGPVNEEFDFDMRAGYFSRWFGDPAWVLNVGGRAILMRTEVVYKEDPPPPVTTFHFGGRFEFFPCVTHPFEELPESLRMKRSESRTLVDLQLYQGDAADILGYFDGKNDPNGALDFAEKLLRARPDDDLTLGHYIARAKRAGQSDRMAAFLRSGLGERPVRIEWHRAYQGLRENPAQYAALIEEYDKLLSADPGNSALLYLRGRIEVDRPAAVDYFTRGQQADPQNPFPHFALGYGHAAAGDWEAARPLVARAVELRPGEPSFQYWLTTIRLALGEAPAIEQEARKLIAAAPVEIHASILLMNALAAQNRPDEVLAVCESFKRACEAKFKEKSKPVVDAVRAHALYVAGDFEALEKFDPAKPPRAARFQALVEQGRIADAEKALPNNDEDEKPVTLLALAVAGRLAGDSVADAKWLEKAKESLSNGNEDNVLASKLLRKADAPSINELKSVAARPSLKALLLVELAARHPQAQAEYTELARRLNVERSFPYHLIRKATAASPQGGSSPQ